MNGLSCWFRNEDLIEQNTFADNEREALAILGSSKPKVIGNIFYQNPIGIVLSAISEDGDKGTGSAILENNGQISVVERKRH